MPSKGNYGKNKGISYIQNKTKKAIEEIGKILASLNGGKTTIRFVLYKLIGMRDENGKHVTHITDTSKGYNAITYLINNARIRQDKGGEYGLPDDCFIDNKREIRHTSADSDVGAFVAKVKDWYDRDIWQDQDTYLFILVEKATVGDVIERIARNYQVPLAVSTGYFGRTFMRQIADKIHKALDEGKEVHIGYIGDHDPSGMDMEESLQNGNDLEGSMCAEGLRQIMGEDNEGNDLFDLCSWERIAVTSAEFQSELSDAVKVPIKQLELDTRGKVAKGDVRSPKYRAKYGDLGAEVEALDSQELQDRVERWILERMDGTRLQMSRATEQVEREKLATLEF